MEANRPSSELRERILEDVHRMVLWGEPEAAVLRRLEVNGITGPKAAEIYAAAFQERVATIREHYRGKTFQGLLLFRRLGGLDLDLHGRF